MNNHMVRRRHLTLSGLLLSLLLLVGCNTGSSENTTSSPDNTTALPRSTPEAEGVSSESILAFLDAVEAGDQELHSFVYLRNGKVIAEGWWDPYRSDLKHTLYSTSKSFTSTAIGFAVSEGLLTVDDPVISFFPDQLPDTISENLAAMTVKHLLTMGAGQDPPPNIRSVGAEENWVTAFLAYPVAKAPGSEFKYNSHATYMLSAIITKLTGESVLDYLRPRLFEPMGIEGMDWETDPWGVSSGGWGLRLKTEDMAKFGQLFLQKGKWNGKQLLPEAWIEEATSMQIDQAPGKSYHARKGNDWQQGYGYKFWRSQHGFYRADGAFGQLIVVMPEKNAVVAVTAEVSDMQKELNLIWDHLLPGMKDGATKTDETAESKEAMEPDEAMKPKKATEPDESESVGETLETQETQETVKAVQEKLKQRLADLALPVPETGTNDVLAEMLNGVTYTFGDLVNSSEQNHKGEQRSTGEEKTTTIQGHPVFSGCSFDLEGNQLFLTLTDASGATHTIAAGAGDWVKGETMLPGPNLVPFYPPNDQVLLPAKIASVYQWQEDNRLEIITRYIESAHTVFYMFGFDGDSLTFQRGATMGLMRGVLPQQGIKME